MLLPPKNDDYIIRKVVINNKPFFDIESENINYATFGETHHGLQCNFDSDSDEYKKIMMHCSEIIKHIKIIDNLISKRSE